MADLNFCTRMFVPAAVLILLSGNTVAEEAKSCYWCGPLAEQVHRSQRAPSCGQELQETMCDKGYTHCAVIATSPPYVESRLCVKFYQDECYSLYCNSSKTWRMICPCQGNLCNGQNTDRETTAFATLAKIVGKNKRNKRSFIGAKGFLSSRQNVNNKTTVIVLSENTTTHSAMQSDQPMDDLIEIIQSTTINNNDILEEHDDENENKNSDENIVEQEDSEMQADQPIEEEIKTNEATATTEDNENVADVKHSETTKTIDEIKADIATTAKTISEDDITTNNGNDLTVTGPTEFIQESRTSMMPTSIEIELSVVTIQNSKDNFPPPEALQQNVTPAKVSAPTTMGTVEMSTNENHIETTTHSIKQTVKNNIEKEVAKNKNVEKQEEGKKNGEEQTMAHLCGLVLLMNILLFLTF